MKVMKEMSEKMRTLGRFRFRKKEKNKAPKIKMVSKRRANVIFLSIVGFVLFLVISGVARMFSLADEFDAIQADMVALQSGSRHVNRDRDTLDLPMVVNVMDEFIPLWIDVDLSDRDVANERLLRLSEMVSFDVNQLNLGIPTTISRRFYDMALLSVSDLGSHHIASYEVVYLIYDQAISEDDEMAYHEVKTVINVPFVMEDHLIAIVSQPFFTDVGEVIGMTDAFSMMESDQSDEMREVRSSVEAFLPIFFDMYAQSDEGQLSLFMNDVVLMGGNFEFVDVDIHRTSFALIGNDVLVQTMVTFADRESDFLHTVPFTLMLSEQANSWFVEELHHLFVQ